MAENLLKKFKWEAKKRELKEKCSEKVNKAVHWCEEHKEFLLIAIPVGSAVIGKTCQVANNAMKAHNLEREQDLRDRRIYSHQDGMYYLTKRKMTTEERLEYERLKKDGYKPGEILDAMGLI